MFEINMFVLLSSSDCLDLHMCLMFNDCPMKCIALKSIVHSFTEVNDFVIMKRKGLKEIHVQC